MTGAEYIAHALYQHGVRRVYEVTGGMITILLDAFYRHGGFEIISMHHEQSAAIAAEVTGRVCDVPGVALATSGPGAINLLAGVASAYFDSSPVVFITGQVNRAEQRKTTLLRQQGFQETDIVSMATPITKWAKTVEDINEIPTLLEHAVRTTFKDRCGPVLIDLPMDVQREELIQELHLEVCVKKECQPELDEVFSQCLDDLRLAQRPLILVGGGVARRPVSDMFRQSLERIKVPVVHSLMGCHVLPAEHPSRIGLIGANGNRWANKALVNADVLVVLGSRLDVRQTGADLGAFKAKKIWHVDCDPAQINNRLNNTHGVLADVSSFLACVCKNASTIHAHQSWWNAIAAWHQKRSDIEELSDQFAINPNRIVRWITQRHAQCTAIVTDVGQNQLWVAQSAWIGETVRFLTSGGLGAMGFALPAAIANAFAHGETLMFAGDGGFQMNIQELQTIVHHRLPVKMVIMNNRALGMVKQFQDIYFEKRYQSTIWGYSSPDFEQVAVGYQIPSRTVTTEDELKESLDWFFEQRYCLLQVMLDQEIPLYPRTMFGKTLDEMEPPVPLDDGIEELL